MRNVSEKAGMNEIRRNKRYADYGLPATFLVYSKRCGLADWYVLLEHFTGSHLKMKIL